MGPYFHTVLLQCYFVHFFRQFMEYFGLIISLNFQQPLKIGNEIAVIPILQMVKWSPETLKNLPKFTCLVSEGLYQNTTWFLKLSIVWSSGHQHRAEKHNGLWNSVDSSTNLPFSFYVQPYTSTSLSLQILITKMGKEYLQHSFSAMVTF